MRYSLISPTFGRPEEVMEFLESLTHQQYTDFEVILGDGTPGDSLRPQLERFQNNPTYPLHIYYEEYLSVSDGRNRAAELAKGDYFIFLDSDCIIPADFLQKIDAHLEHHDLALFGGPDKAHPDFTDLQKAISYSMTSIFTTGGIRGAEKSLAAYHPRGFNMGIRRDAFEAVGGYSEFRCGEDVELSIRIIKAGFQSGYIPQAHVYHKRRTSLKQFYKQVFRFGAARINIWKRHPEELKAAHLFPLVFTLSLVVAVLILPLQIYGWVFLLPIMGFVLYFAAIFVGALLESKKLYVAGLAVLTSITMLFGYGTGFLRNALAYWRGAPNGLKL